jgi:hypothetical protein
MLKPPGTKHLKLKCDILLTTFAFNSNLHRYTLAGGGGTGAAGFQDGVVGWCRLTL